MGTSFLNFRRDPWAPTHFHSVIRVNSDIRVQGNPLKMAMLVVPSPKSSLTFLPTWLEPMDALSPDHTENVLAAGGGFL